MSLPPPAWHFLLSHHLPNRFNRCIRVSLGRHTMHFCARCMGLVFGLFALVVVWGMQARLPVDYYGATFQLPIALLPLPAAIDWLRQSVKGRESTNVRRLVTGMFLGVAWTDAIILFVTRPWPDGVAAAVCLALYFLAIVLVLSLTGTTRRVVEEHFPGMAV